jgi:hypothetical protein
MRRTSALALIVLLAACSGGDDGGGGDASGSEAEVSEQSVEVPAIELEVTRSEFVSPHQGRAAIPEKAAVEAVDVVQSLFDATVVDAAVRGEPGDATALFTDDALERLRTKDYAALVDDRVGPLEGLEAEKARVGLTALAGDDNQPALVVAAIDWDVHSPDGAVRITRVGELSLVPASPAGGWVIAAYSVVTERTVDGETTTTTSTTEAGGS